MINAAYFMRSITMQLHQNHRQIYHKRRSRVKKLTTNKNNLQTKLLFSMIVSTFIPFGKSMLTGGDFPFGNCLFYEI